MLGALGILLLLVALAVHEAGHAVAMLRRGIDIEEAGLGLPIGQKLQLTLRPGFLPFPVKISPLLFGAYVRPSAKGMDQLKSLPYKDQAVCYSAGVVVNIVFGGAVLAATAGAVLVTGGSSDPGHTLALMLASGGIAAAVAVFRRAFSQIVPALGAAALLLLAYLISLSADNVGGPDAVFTTAASGKSLVEALVICAALSVSLAYFNILPLVPLDGGRVMSAFLETRGWKRLNMTFNVTSVIGFLGFIGFVLAKGFF